MKKERLVTVILIVVFVVGFCVLIVNTGELKDSGDSKKNTKTNVTKGSQKDNSGTIETSTPTPTTAIVESPTPTPDPIVGTKTVFNDLGIGGIGKKGNVYVGLQYVKVMPYLPTALGKETVPEGDEVIIAFFEIYNNSGDVIRFLDDDISCYADGVQVGEVETYIVTEIDGIRGTSLLSLENTFQLLTALDYEVPKGWKELKFFYKSECVWTVSAEETSTKEFVNEPLIQVEKDTPYTKADEIIYNNGYSVQFKGAEFYRQKKSYLNDDYAVFKFTISNTGNDALDTDLMGYKMQVYCDNYFVRDPSFTMKDKIDGYVNIYDVKKIEAGMSANVYIAFECPKKAGMYYLLYDDGYITNHYCGYVCVELK